MANKVLEMNLISAQGLKSQSSTNTRGLHTFAVVWVDPSQKLRTRIDRAGGENPTWNDKFLFRVSEEFLSSETSGVSFEIYAVGRLRNPLIGSARFVVSNLHGAASSPGFFPLHIQRPSGRFQGILNVGANLINTESDFMKGSTAIGYRDLMGEGVRRQKREAIKKIPRGKKGEMAPEKENIAVVDPSGEFSDGGDSTTSSSSSSSTVLQDWNSLNRSFSFTRSSTEGGGIFCGLGLGMHRRLSLCLSAASFPRK